MIDCDTIWYMLLCIYAKNHIHINLQPPLVFSSPFSATHQRQECWMWRDAPAGAGSSSHLGSPSGSWLNPPDKLSDSLLDPPVWALFLLQSVLVNLHQFTRTKWWHRVFWAWRTLGQWVSLKLEYTPNLYVWISMASTNSCVFDFLKLDFGICISSG